MDSGAQVAQLLLPERGGRFHPSDRGCRTLFGLGLENEVKSVSVSQLSEEESNVNQKSEHLEFTKKSVSI